MPGLVGGGAVIGGLLEVFGVLSATYWPVIGATSGDHAR
jgi:hypothetical protein